MKTNEDIEADDDIADKDRAKALAAMLRTVMDNEGTDKAITDGVDHDGDSDTPEVTFRLFITHQGKENDPDYESALVDFEIPRYYSFNGILESYAPKHTTTFTLYPLREELDIEADPILVTDPNSYESDEFLVYELTSLFGSGLWRQDFSMKSSTLMGKDRTGQIYKLVVSKPGHVTYTWLGLEFAPATLDNPTDSDCLTFTLDSDINEGMIALIGGDLDGNGVSGLEDLELMTGLMSGEILYTKEQDESNTSDWEISTYNSESLAYAADLDGNGKIGAPDLKILNDKRNFRQRAACYQEVMPQLIHGLDGTVSGGGTIFYMLLDEVEALPAWVEELLAEGKTLPDWINKMLQDKKPVPDWVQDMLEAETSIPDWAAEMVLMEKDVPTWMIDAIWDGKAIPTWAIDVVNEGKTLPLWAVELAKAGDELPEELQVLLLAGQELPEELPESTVVPELPMEDDLIDSETEEVGTSEGAVRDDSPAGPAEDPGDSAAMPGEEKTPDNTETENPMEKNDGTCDGAKDEVAPDDLTEKDGDKASNEGPVVSDGDMGINDGTAEDSVDDGFSGKETVISPVAVIPSQSTE